MECAEARVQVAVQPAAARFSEHDVDADGEDAGDLGQLVVDDSRRELETPSGDRHATGRSLALEPERHLGETGELMPYLKES
ncbi:hypothetical protein [Streptomyces sp. BRA346]|uniref:hypothetical protein n=1 Tax=Streptomyces sp. BRA346 TaxID=2878199 RepID=UPI0040648998